MVDEPKPAPRCGVMLNRSRPCLAPAKYTRLPSNGTIVPRCADHWPKLVKAVREVPET